MICNTVPAQLATHAFNIRQYFRSQNNNALKPSQQIPWVVRLGAVVANVGKLTIANDVNPKFASIGSDSSKALSCFNFALR